MIPREALPALVLAIGACAPASGITSAPVPARPLGARRYEFTSSQTTASGTHRTRLVFRLTSAAGPVEYATVLSYENADATAAFAPASLSPACADAMRTPDGGLLRFDITPPPRNLSSIVPSCAPEDLWGAASDILPLFMIQAQPQFRARELRRPGDVLRFRGYDTRWRIPPTLLDQRIVADSGTIQLESMTDASSVVAWDTSPMRVSAVRRLPTGQNALLEGHEWFAARLRLNRRTGDLIAATTEADSLRLHMRIGYSADTVPASANDTSGMLVRVTRRLELRLLPDAR